MAGTGGRKEKESLLCDARPGRPLPDSRARLRQRVCGKGGRGLWHVEDGQTPGWRWPRPARGYSPRDQTSHKPRQARTVARYGVPPLAGRTYARTDSAQNQAGNGRAQFPHSRTIPHKFFCRLLPKDAK